MEDENLATIPYRKIHVKIDIRYIIHLPGKQRIITYSSDGSFRVWDLERGTQFGEEWEDKKIGVHAIALSPDGKTIASGSSDGVVKLRNVDTGKVIKTLTGHTNRICSVCWSSGGGRVVSGSWDETFRVWNVESGQTIIGPIKAMDGGMNAVCYSPDANMIATGGYTMLKIWDANTGELLKTLNAEVNVTCLAWTSDGKTLITGGMFSIMKFNTATWTPVVGMWKMFINTISLSPNEHILACASGAPLDKKVPLLDLETNQPIGTLVHNEDAVNSATFSADEKFLITSCSDGHIYTWDLSAIVKNATPRPVSKINGAHRIPTGFFDDALRDTNSQGVHNPPAPAPSKRTLSRFSTFWRRSKPHGANEPNTQSRSRPLSWTRNLVSGILRRREGSGIQLGEVNVPYTAGKPRNYHARKKKAAASSSRPPNTHTTQQFGEAAQSIPSSSQLPPPTTTASTFSAIPGTTRAMGIISRPHIAGAGRRARFVGWVCCMPIQNVDGYH